MTREECIEALQRWAAEHGRRPACNDWRKTPEGMPPRSMLDKHFGSWRAAMLAAGFEDRGPGNYPRTDRSGDDCANPHCDRKVGGGARGRCHRCYRYRRVYGEEWRDRTEELRAEVCELIRELAADLGRPPMYREFVAAARQTVGVARRPDSLFGTWGDAVEAAGLERQRHGFGSLGHPLRQRR